MTEKTINYYLKTMNINEDDTFSKEEAVQLINKNVVSYYKGRVRLTEDKEVFTGYEIADKLHTLAEVLRESFDKAIEEEESKDDI